MPGFKRLATLMLLILLCAPALPTSAKNRSNREIFEQLLGGHKLINVVDDFLAFWEVAKHQPLARQRQWWLHMVEDKHRDYFERAVYRNANANERRALLDEFLVRVPERVDAIREFNRQISDIHTSLLGQAFIFFRWRFADYQQQHDLYIGLSLFRFDGATRPVHNEAGVPDTLCLGAETLCRYTPEQIRVTILHEFFHLYHFSFLFQQPKAEELRTPHIPLMIEGMAVAATEAIEPGQPTAFYLHFADDELATQQRELMRNAARFLALLDKSAPPDQYEPWFVNRRSDEAPPRAGYLLGYEVSKRVLASFTLDQMVRMTPAELREHAEEQLAVMSGRRLLMLAASH
jgi:hypothetical protein